MVNNLKLNPNPQQQQPQPQQPSPEQIMQLDNIKCECGSQKFNPAFVIKRVSPLQSSTGKETFIPLQIFVCSNCGMSPAGLGKELLKEEEQSFTITNPHE